jgi:hypothetical protein
VVAISGQQTYLACHETTALPCPQTPFKAYSLIALCESDPIPTESELKLLAETKMRY